jgi:hypothetical protein
MWADRARLVRDDESGFAMITALVMSSVMMLFTVGMLATGLHLTSATVRDRRWNTALQVAEAGLDRAVYEIGKDETYAGTGANVLSVPGGEVQLLIARPTDGQVVVYSTAWVPARTAEHALSRRIEVSFAPQDVFKYALFSETGLFVKNYGEVIGDVFANEGVQIENNAVVDGSVISATEGVSIGMNAEVRVPEDGIGGNVYSGGPAGITLEGNSVVEGSAFAQATSCGGSPGVGDYGITAAGTVHGDAIAWGQISGSVLGSRTPSSCELAPAVQVLPTYTWDPSLYTDEVEYTSIAAFQTYIESHPDDLRGVHHVWVDACASDPSGVGSEIDWGSSKSISSDFVLVTNCRLSFKNNITVTAPSSALIDIVVLNSSSDPASVEIKNSFIVENDPAVLLYSPGLISVKNNPDHNGAVYAGAITVKNNLDVTYDPRVERTLGFGNLKYDRVSWVECTASSTGTDC